MCLKVGDLPPLYDNLWETWGYKKASIFTETDVGGQVMDGDIKSWLENPRPKRRFVAGKIIYKWGMFKCHIFDCRMVLLKILKVGDMTDMIHPVIMVIFLGIHCRF